MGGGCHDISIIIYLVSLEYEDTAMVWANVCTCFRVIVVMYTGEMIENDTISIIIDLTVIWQI